MTPREKLDAIGRILHAWKLPEPDEGWPEGDALRAPSDVLRMFLDVLTDGRAIEWEGLAAEVNSLRDENRLLREGLRRLAFSEVEIEDRGERADVHNAAILLSDPTTIEMSGTLVQESAQRGLASIREAAKVGR